MNIDEIKQQAEIAAVVQATGFEITGHGRYLKTSIDGHKSVVLDTFKNYYYYNREQEAGSVIDWVMNRKGYEFKDAVKEVCQICGLPVPDWSEVNIAEYSAAKERMDVWTAASGIFAMWLKNEKLAMDYAVSRGWDKDTIEKASIGYTGYVDWNAPTATADYDALCESLRSQLVAGGYSVDTPAVVALTGKRFSSSATMMEWISANELDEKELNPDWIERKRIPGLIGRGMLVYPHIERGQVVYFSGRSVPAINEKAHYNIPIVLGGSKQLYKNAVWTPRSETCIIVEGQADAISLGQMGIAAVALAGLAPTEELEAFSEKHKKLYVCLDMDKAGQNGIDKICQHLHPLTMVVKLPDLEDDEITVKDVNDFHKVMVKREKANEEIGKFFRANLLNSTSYIEHKAAQTGSTKDQFDHDVLEQETVKLYWKLDELQQTQYRDRIAKAMNRKLRDFDNLVKQLKNKAQEDKDKPADYIFSYGGFFDGWLLQYVYDRENNTASWAYRDPEGKISTAAYVDIWRNGERIRYYPEPPYSFIEMEQIGFPSKLPKQSKSIKELLAIILAFINKYYYFTDERYAQLIAYWVLGTWFYDACEAFSYLRALGPAGCGKTELMKRVTQLCYQPIRSSGNDTPAVLFRTIAMFNGGTIHISEYDQDNSDTTAAFIKILLEGAMKGGSTNRMERYTDDNGVEKMRPQPFPTYCPKCLDGRRETKDDALSTRCITIWVYPVDQATLKAAHIPLFVDEKFRQAAKAIQNEMLRYRLENWEETFPIDNELDVDNFVSPRMNQVTAPLRTIVRKTGDEDALKALNELLREIHEQERSNQMVSSIVARVVEGLWEILRTPMLFKEGITIDEEGSMMVKPGYAAKVTNQIMDKMNDADGDDDEDGPRRSNRGITARGVGAIFKGQLSMQSTRKRDGFHYKINLPALVGQMTSYMVPWKEDLAEMRGTVRWEHIPKELQNLMDEFEIVAVVPTGREWQSNLEFGGNDAQ